MNAAFFENDDPATRTKLYLRILYGRNYLDRARALADASAHLPVLTRRLIASIDFGAMELEQLARIRNLARHLARAVPSVHCVLGHVLFDALVADFTNSEAFWSQRGRSLGENFCLFAHVTPGFDLTGFHRDTLKGSGIAVGLAADPEVACPWAPVEAIRLRSQADELTETFLSDFTLVDGTGRFADPANLDLVSERACARIVVSRSAVGRVVAYSIAL